MQKITPGGKRYIITVIDYYSRYTKVYLLTYKSEAIEQIKEDVSYVETKFQNILKRIRSDRGG